MNTKDGIEFCTMTSHFIPFSVCTVDFFIDIDKTLSYGGRLVEYITQLEACKDECLKDTNCKAVDYDLVYNMCFLHVDGYLQEVVTGVDAEGVKQYRRITCPPSGKFPV